ncbi:Vegetative incompatibility protein HET-E-1 [Colletotrichum siamense]|uniref:Vegetative incompatibility protein HET-E-1 n=1 Tax=Colletotrichum siamense TaxID=690259 RepID=UPI001872E769|nr:Vegetative incompatibility protein HET-E-1 [Colletotrichum siamense]KAF5500358.1 Vegetative incompatibility protein HET-E-1 [Colletotrichum siamense]
MRLLDARTLRVLEFNNDAIPPYAILSHTWGEEEITYQDLNPQLDQIYSQIKAMGNFLKAKNGYQFSSQVKTKKGFLKVEQAAKRALADRYDYIWIDTCCIDKSSSAELSEAINSMYQWYQGAGICYAFLSDVTTRNNGRAWQEATIRSSRWFTRGWTLQELIAPRNMQFFSAEWDFLGSKVGSQLNTSSNNLIGPHILGEITGIDERVLDGSLGPQDLSVATRMSWAALRQTTRLEDLAYCLLGVFSVNMPLLYGEGSRAFVRLQEAIMRETDDQSIFAWTKTDLLPSKSTNTEDLLSGLLADSPMHFLKSTGIRPLPPLLSGETMPTTISNQGLNLKLYLRPINGEDGIQSSDRFHAILDCSRIIQGVESSPAIYLKRLWGNQYARILPESIELLKPPGLEVPLAEEGYKTVNVRQNPVHLVPDFNVNPDSLGPRRVKAAYPRNRWDSSAWILKSTYGQVGGVMGIIELEDLRSERNSGTITVFVGIEASSGAHYKPWCMPVKRQGGFSMRFLFEMADESARHGRLLPNTFGSPENVCVAQVSEIVRHGRSYVSLTVEDVPELGYYHFQHDPALNFAPAREVAGPVDCARKLAKVLQPSTVEDFGASSLFEGSFVGKRIVRVRPAEQLLSYTDDLLQRVPDQIETDMKEDMFDIEDQQKAERLLEFCRDGELDMVKQMGSVKTLLGVKTINFFGFTPLHWAVFGGYVKLAEYLLEQGASIMPGTEFKPANTALAPIHLIAILGQDEFLGILQKYVDMEPRWLETTTSPCLDFLSHLVVMSDRFSEGLLRAFTSRRTSLTYYGNDANMLGERPMHRAVATRNSQALIFLLKQCNVDINLNMFTANVFMAKWAFFDQCQRSVVWHAAASGFAEGIRLMYHGLYIIRDYLDRPDDMGVSPMHIACRQGHDKVVEMLISLGAKANGEATLGLTPAHFAAFFGHAACLQRMAYHGVDLDTPAIHLHGLRPLHLAALRGQLECVEVLSRSGANQHSLAYAVFKTHKEWWEEGNVDDMEWTELDSPMTPMGMAFLRNHSLVAQRLAHWRSNTGKDSVPHRKQGENHAVRAELPA